MTSEWLKSRELAPRLQTGDCIEIYRGRTFSHWVLYVGYGSLRSESGHIVIEKTLEDGEPETIFGTCKGKINYRVFDEIANGDDCRINNCLDKYTAPRSPTEIIRLAKTELTERPKCSYQLLIDNCEHFVFHCRNGEWYSSQSDYVVRVMNVGTRVKSLFSWILWGSTKTEETEEEEEKEKEQMEQVIAEFTEYTQEQTQ